MNIKQAKQQIERSMKAYFAKDEFGEYRLSVNRQRPVFLIGAPGIGKTAIMEQIAQELEVGFVAYSMTHHTRQSALGLPFISHKTYGGEEYDVSEYTMSEIIASVYETMEATGKKEGILFLDEINCVSETLTPAMLQFLQYKVFGRHRVPDGWIVVTAGNPPEYNRTVHDFDMATWDRLKRIDVDPDYTAWRDYAVETGVHPAVLTYLDIEQGHFYHVETTVDGMSFVTARGWDDLSSIIKLYEEQNLPVDDLLIGQYVQSPEIAKHFSVYYELFTKYRSDYQIDRIVEGTFDQGIVERAQEAGFDERVSLMGLITDALIGVVREAVSEEKAVAFTHEQLAALRDRMAKDTTEDARDLAQKAAAEIRKKAGIEKAAGLLSSDKKLSYERAAGLLEAVVRNAEGCALSFDNIKAKFEEMLDALDGRLDRAARGLDNVFRFVEEAFGDGQEMLLLVTDLSVNRYSMAFINDHGCERYFAHNEKLLFRERGDDLIDRINRLNLEEE